MKHARAPGQPLGWCLGRLNRHLPRLQAGPRPSLILSRKVHRLDTHLILLPWIAIILQRACSRVRRPRVSRTKKGLKRRLKFSPTWILSLRRATLIMKRRLVQFTKIVVNNLKRDTPGCYRDSLKWLGSMWSQFWREKNPKSAIITRLFGKIKLSNSYLSISYQKCTNNWMQMTIHLWHMPYLCSTTFRHSWTSWTRNWRWTWA